jgi:putative FmdB family regulatory protein
MPIYEYVCKKCGREFEELVRGNEQPACPACGEPEVERQISAPAAHVGGSRDSACPARHACSSPSCCGSQGCGLNQLM